MFKLSDAWWPLALATMAGLSTSLGAIVAVVRKPSASSMAALLGVALGVMATVSCVELVARNAMSGEGDPFLVLAAAIAGALTYYILEPMFPKMDDQHDYLKKQDDLDLDHDHDHEALLHLLVQQQEQLQQQHQYSNCDTERSGHGVSQRKVVTSSAGSYGAAAVTAGGGISGASAAAALAAPGGTLVAGVTGCSLTRKGSSSNEAHLSVIGPATAIGGGGGGGGGGAGRENSSSLLGPGQLAGGAAGGNSTTGSSGEGLVVFGSGVMLPGGGGGGGSGAMCDGGFLSPSGSVGAAGGLAAGGLAAALGRRDPRAGRMLRLGVLMAITMTLHNLPEGFAVAFSAFTEFGPIMALAIAVHNIPEGVIVAAPIFAATGSRWRAVGIATASGLSEPFGALLALLLLQPFFTQERLHYLLAFVGGIMLAVCGIELWPEGRNCRHDRHFAGGIVAGSVVMGWTLYVEG
ncbi:hypothetical protein VaNZ11_005013 [Volvox africanus]|uniref:Uncharacterized protein n=1 Tax=Volvox africanus TaxID=51714 RepID=A0ABQ5RYA7_9CHLO|nr:hypothetical protein VaNZ11_005013 [Volvox africanus]